MADLFLHGPSEPSGGHEPAVAAGISGKHLSGRSNPAAGPRGAEVGDHARAIALYNNLTRLTKSQLRGEGQYGIGECYEDMAKAARGNSEQMYERAFQAYKVVFDQHPESGRVEMGRQDGEFLYQKKDYGRAVDVFEKVLSIIQTPIFGCDPLQLWPLPVPTRSSGRSAKTI